MSRRKEDLILLTSVIVGLLLIGVILWLIIGLPLYQKKLEQIPVRKQGSSVIYHQVEKFAVVDPQGQYVETRGFTVSGKLKKDGSFDGFCIAGVPKGVAQGQIPELNADYLVLQTQDVYEYWTTTIYGDPMDPASWLVIVQDADGNWCYYLRVDEIQQGIGPELEEAVVKAAAEKRLSQLLESYN